jgi:hypothetical protein
VRSLELALDRIADLEEQLRNAQAAGDAARSWCKKHHPATPEPPYGSIEAILAMNANSRCTDCATE